MTAQPLLRELKSWRGFTVASFGWRASIAKSCSSSILDEQPREQVAETLGIPQGYLRVLLHRAREHVRNCSFVDHDDFPEAE